MTIDPKKRSPIERAVKEAASDRTLADELLEQHETQKLHALCRRMIDEREALANGLNAITTAWTMLKDEATPSRRSDPDALASVERIATEAIQFAREVIQALKPTKE